MASAGMINNEGLNVDLYIPRKCVPPRSLPVGRGRCCKLWGLPP